MRSLFAVFALFCGSCSMVPGTDANAIKVAEKSLADASKDPRSTEFRNVTVLNGKTVCGEVNSKNGFGAYVGFTPFAYGADGSGFIATADAIDTEDQVELPPAAKVCFQAKYPALIAQIAESNRINQQADRLDAIASRSESGAPAKCDPALAQSVNLSCD
jgi:hypothetical protein